MNDDNRDTFVTLGIAACLVVLVILVAYLIESIG